MGNPHNVDRGDIVVELEKFGKIVSGQHPGDIADVVTVTSSMGMLTSCSLYLLAPLIRYEYKVIEIDIESVKEATVRFITLATGQIEPYAVDISKGARGISSTLLQIRSLPLFGVTIEALLHRINLKKGFREDIAGKIVVGQARVGVLKNGERISVGWIKIEDDKVWYYTAKGLHELWRPGLAGEDLRTAERLRALPLDEKIALGYVAERSLSEFEEIE